MKIAAIMPCRGRPEQTVANVRRLIGTAGYDDWRLVCVVSRDEQPLADALLPLTGPQSPLIVFEPFAGRVTYWKALAAATDALEGRVTPLIANLANDLLPGQFWLRRAVEAYQQLFGNGDGMIGFNDGHHEVEHSCHFLISRGLVERYGGWPVHYDHNFGDTEICQRAIADGVYAKAPWAVLYHDHPYFGGKDDPVYAEGRAQNERDYQLFEQRRRQGWPRVSP